MRADEVGDLVERFPCFGEFEIPLEGMPHPVPDVQPRVDPRLAHARRQAHAIAQEELPGAGGDQGGAEPGCEVGVERGYEGISKVGDVLDIAVEEDIVEKRGSFYSYGETRLGQGRENTKGFLRDNPDLALEIENKAREAKDLPTLQDSLEEEQGEQETGV